MNITKPKIFEKYPQILTDDQFDSIKWDFVKEYNRETTMTNSQACNRALKLIQKHKGKLVLYTQIDSDPYPVYDKGYHLCNRTGIYAVVKSKEIENNV